MDNLFESDEEFIENVDMDKSDESPFDHASYVEFMQSQIDPSTEINNNVAVSEEAENIFFDSNEELSDLDCFTSIQDLLSRGGDDQRRAEFILRQFIKTDNRSTKSTKTTSTKKKVSGAGRSLGLRRNR